MTEVGVLIVLMGIVRGGRLQAERRERRGPSLTNALAEYRRAESARPRDEAP
jgi:hypothetical protein